MVSMVSAKAPEHAKPQVEKKKEQKKKAIIKSKQGKVIEKRLNTSEATINNITKAIDATFKVNEEGKAEAQFDKRVVNKKYSSYAGKLKAEINKLRAIDKQIAVSKKKDKKNATDYKALEEKSKQLQQLAKDEIKRLKSLVEQATAPKVEEIDPTPEVETPEVEDKTPTPEVETPEETKVS
ncbi:hypothetical protein [Bacillus sp. FJAT-42315]|uniref:hypothetical protein n=1 Tax=Bacillus sp. FJAT-42315 TaxID=2014077 RepID=UPI000C24FB97|nr:hypothetical protein [Bacillus sp. FJAT-42315]